jgi:hypothetical protein
MGAERGQVSPGARAEFEEHRLGRRQVHDALHVVFDALDEAGRTLRKLVGVFRLLDFEALGIPAPVAPIPGDAVLVIQADVEPHRRVERPVLMEAEPRQLAVEPLGILVAGEVAVLLSPVGNRPRDAMDQLPHASFALGGAVLAIEVLADDDVGGKLGPAGGNLDVPLLEHGLARFVLDRGTAEFPGDRVEGIGDVGWAKDGIDPQPLGQVTQSFELCRLVHAAASPGSRDAGH